MYIFFGILLVLFLVLLLAARFLRKIISAFISHSGIEDIQKEKNGMKNEIIYQKNDIVVLKGDANSSIGEDQNNE